MEPPVLAAKTTAVLKRNDAMSLSPYFTSSVFCSLSPNMHWPLGTFNGLLKKRLLEEFDEDAVLNSSLFRQK